MHGDIQEWECWNWRGSKTLTLHLSGQGFLAYSPVGRNMNFAPGAGKYWWWFHEGLNSSCSKRVSWERAAAVGFMKNYSPFLPGYRVHFSTDTSLTNTQRERGMGSQVIVLSWQRLVKEEQDLYRGCSEGWRKMAQSQKSCRHGWYGLQFLPSVGWLVAYVKWAA